MSYLLVKHLMNQFGERMAKVYPNALKFVIIQFTYMMFMKLIRLNIHALEIFQMALDS